MPHSTEERQVWDALDRRTERIVRDKIAQILQTVAYQEKERQNGPTHMSDTLGRLSSKLLATDDLPTLLDDIRAGAGIG